MRLCSVHWSGVEYYTIYPLDYFDPLRLDEGLHNEV